MIYYYTLNRIITPAEYIFCKSSSNYKIPYMYVIGLYTLLARCMYIGERERVWGGRWKNKQ